MVAGLLKGRVCMARGCSSRLVFGCQASPSASVTRGRFTSSSASVSAVGQGSPHQAQPEHVGESSASCSCREGAVGDQHLTLQQS